MRCRICKYELLNTAERRCPECGCEFDPNDPKTWSPLPPTAPWGWIAAFSIAGLAFWLAPAFTAVQSGYGWSALLNPGLAIASILFASALALVIDWYIRYRKFED